MADRFFVSVILPSRARPDHLILAVDSVFARASVPEDVEVLVRIDDDDVERNKPFYEYAQRVSPHWPVRIFTGPRGRGYDDLHLMYNQLAAAATGKWLFQYNDDMRITTRGWDSELQKIKTHPTVALVNPCDAFGRVTTIHPFVLRAGIQAMGHFSQNPFCDAWVGDVFGRAGAITETKAISITHLRDDLNDEVVEGQRQSTGWSLFNTPDQIAQRVADAESLKKLMAA